MKPPGKRLNKENNRGCLSIELTSSMIAILCLLTHNCILNAIMPFEFGTVIA